MNTAVAMRHDAGDLMEQVIIKGDLSNLTPEQRSSYYMRVCDSVGLNALTRPLEYLTLNGRLVLYARRDAADQLRKINGVSVEILSQSVSNGLLTVHVRAKDKTGRTDEDFGVVNIGALKGEAAANAMLKAVTKAKRRVTLSISGLGFLDETEVEDIPPSARGFARRDPAPSAVQPAAIEPPHDPATGEIAPHAIDVPLLADQSGADWIAWGGRFVAAIKTARSLPELHRWCEANDAALKLAANEAPKVFERVKANIDDVQAKASA